LIKNQKNHIRSSVLEKKAKLQTNPNNLFISNSNSYSGGSGYGITTTQTKTQEPTIELQYNPDEIFVQRDDGSN
jgi:hypothetical protein